MFWLVLGLVVFFATHSVSILAPGRRDRAVARIGEGPWKGLLGIVSLGGLVLIVIGYGLAREHPIWLYFPPTWMRHVALGLLVFVFPLALAACFRGRISDRLKHPLLAAVKTWALAHLLVNGTVADVLLFGGFLAWAVADRISLQHRPARPSPGAPARPVNDWIAVIGGVVLYAAFVLGLHRWLIGVPVLR